MKILAISDIHLRDYHQFNKFPRQRLKSFPELAKDIVQVGVDNDLDILLLGGDIVDKNTLSPLELHSLFDMFTELSKQFRIYSIVGNHDAKSKKSIDREDTVITLLEKIGNISFHHQEILEIGGRTIAFENWMPEYDLSWYEDSVDIYMSHAAIDYDDSGIFGMDTSVFDNKFTLGLFGDIHMPKQVGNIVSIGNTKQESLSDRYQGGVMILDLDDLSFERVPLDPDHKKYLHLEPTVLEEEDGWVDFEGEDMTYKVYRPAKVKGKAFEFSLPEITDIEARTLEVMKEVGLEKLHFKIAQSSSYDPIDFNFKLLNLDIHNFRSVADYSLNFEEDFVITGHNGSGKSTLITGLFYALIGKKTLKQDIKFGEKECHLVVSLTYQDILFCIRRGTTTGDYSLMIDGELQKYNSKLEFEKDVFNKLPFLNYHESFFFNYWDTELLGTIKLDRRYDLLCKYYRLDSLTSYNDTAEERFKSNKKKWKELQASLESAEVLLESRDMDYSDARNILADKPSRKVVESELISHKSYLQTEKRVQGIRNEIEDLSTELETKKSEVNNLTYLLSETNKDLTTDLSQEELETNVENYDLKSTLESRISSGTTLVSEKTLEVESLKSNTSLLSERLKGLGSSTRPQDPIELVEGIAEARTKFQDLERDINSFELSKSLEIDKWTSLVDSTSKSLDKVKEDSTEDTVCTTCDQPIKHEDLITSLSLDLKNHRKSLKSSKDALEGYSSTKSKKLKEISKWKGEVESKNQEAYSIRNLISKWEESESERGSLNSTIKENTKEVEELTIKLEVYTSSIKEIQASSDKINEVSKEDYLTYSSDVTTLSKISTIKGNLTSAESTYSTVKLTYSKKIDELELDIVGLTNKLEFITKLDEETVASYNSLLAKYESLESLKVKYNSALEARDSANLKASELGDEVDQLDSYCQLTSRSGQILKSVLDDLTKTFSAGNFRFNTIKTQASGKVVTDMSVDYLVSNKWVPYTSLSSGQRTLCDLYYISKVVTGVGVISFDETLRFLDDENLKVAAVLIDNMKKSNLLISSHSSNLSMDGTRTLRCELAAGGTTTIEVIS